MEKKRIKVHGNYYKIKAYQAILDISDEEICNKLAISVRTYNDKILGWADFTRPEYAMLTVILSTTLEELAKTRQEKVS